MIIWDAIHGIITGIGRVFVWQGQSSASVTDPACAHITTAAVRSIEFATAGVRSAALTTAGVRSVSVSVEACDGD